MVIFGPITELVTQFSTKSGNRYFASWKKKLSANQDWYLPVPTYGSTWVVLWLPLRSLTQGPLLRVHFGESLVIDYTQKSTISTLAVKLSVPAIIYPWWTATGHATATFVNFWLV